MRKIFLVLLVFAVAVFAQKATNKVKSKRGDLNLTAAAGGGSTVCTASFNDEMTIIKQQDSYTLVRGSCGQGWVNNSDVEKVLQGPGDKGFNIDAVDVVGWMDNPSAVFVLDQDAGSFEGINIDRNFNEYLKNTVDREQTEMRNQEN
ncbi:MAG: hypothetical protein LBB36_03460 [Fibromonadaceae bacterium]|jgi:uncharacterized membrane protein|nr:hypothetical protein [Fibromonadaceae bacterium]